MNERQDVQERNDSDSQTRIKRFHDPRITLDFEPREHVELVLSYIQKIKDELEQVRHQSQAELADIKSDNRRLLEQETRYRQEIDSLKSVISNYKDQLETRDFELEQIRKREAEIKMKVAKLESELAMNQDKVEILEERYKESQERVKEYQKESERVIGQNSMLASKLEKREAEIDQKQRQIAEQETLTKKMRSEYREAQEKIGVLQIRYEESERKFNEEKNRLSGRILHESQQELRILQNRIEANLTSNLHQLEKIRGVPMTEAIGENLKAQMKEMFDKLRDLGIPFGRR